jgi:hypothetical protein
MSRPADEPQPWRGSKQFKRLCELSRACQDAINRGIETKQIYRLLRQRREAGTRHEHFDIAQKLYQMESRGRGWLAS